METRFDLNILNFSPFLKFYEKLSTKDVFLLELVSKTDKSQEMVEFYDLFGIAILIPKVQVNFFL